MFRQSSSRNSRTRGIRVKHVLQICLLLGVCFWLIYQVKHSHDKKKEFGEDGVRVQAENDMLKFGRKELNPHLEKLITLKEKRVEEEEEEEAGGDDQLLHDEIETKENEEEDLEEEESKQEEEESKNGETEDGDEIDEHDQEKADQIEDFVDEEKDGEVTESEEKEGQVENDGSTDNPKTHEAREENYKGDDASSAVAHDIQVITAESKSSEDSEMEVSEQENKSIEIDGGQKNSSLTLGEGQMAENEVLNVNNSSSYKPEENSTMATELSEKLHVSNDSSQVSTERSNNSTGENVVITELVFLQNGTEAMSEIKLYNATVESEQAHNATTSGGDQFDSNSTLPSAEFVNSLNHSGLPLSESNLSSNTTVEAENSSSGSSTKEDMDPTLIDKSGEVNKGSVSSTDESIVAVQHNPLDSSIAQDEENRIDLDVLPESKTEGDGNDDAAAE